jgi:hypothetical protein
MRSDGAGHHQGRPAPRPSRRLRPARQRRRPCRRARSARKSLPLRVAATGRPGRAGAHAPGQGAASLAPALARRHTRDPVRTHGVTGKARRDGATAPRQSAHLPRRLCTAWLLPRGRGQLAFREHAELGNGSGRQRIGRTCSRAVGCRAAIERIFAARRSQRGRVGSSACASGECCLRSTPAFPVGRSFAPDLGPLDQLHAAPVDSHRPPQRTLHSL